jgi:serine protease Do
MSAADAKEFGLSKPGALIMNVAPGGPAATGGMKPDDIVVAFGGKPVRRSEDLIALVTRTTPGTTVPVTVVRGGKEVTLNIKVEELDLAAEAGQQEEPVEVSSPDAPVETGIGVSVEPITPSVMRQLRVPEGRGGAVVAEVSPRSSALGALTAGDVILGINGTTVSSVNEVKTRLERASTGTLVRVLVWRRGAEQVAIFRKR